MIINQLKLMVFSLDDQYYALPLTFIDKVLQSVAITHVPKGYDNLLGIVNVHGEIMPVIDIRKIFGIPAKKIHLHDRFIVCDIQNKILKNIIIIADSIINLSNYAVDKISSMNYSENKNTAYIRGVINNQG